MEKYGWLFCKANTDAAKIAQDSLDAVNNVIDNKNWGRISGDYYQYNLLQHSFGKKLQDELANYAKQFIPNGTNLVAKHLKLLLAPPGSGPQAPHRDGLDRDHYVVAFYLSKNRSTDVSKIERPEKAITEMTVAEKKQLSGDHWTQLQNFECNVGDMLIFAEDTVHRGIKNEQNNDRYVLFTVLGPPMVKHSDRYQHFEWSWYAELYGSGSQEHLSALVRNMKYKPIKHYRKNQRTILNYQLKRLR